MPNVIRLSRLQVTSVFGTRIRVSRVSASTAAVTPVGNRLRVSRLTITSQFEPTNVNRIRVSRVTATATTKGPGSFMWDAGKILAVRAYMWLNGQIVPISTPSAVILPPDPPVPTDVYNDVYNDTY